MAVLLKINRLQLPVTLTESPSRVKLCFGLPVCFAVSWNKSVGVLELRSKCKLTVLVLLIDFLGMEGMVFTSFGKTSFAANKTWQVNIEDLPWSCNRTLGIFNAVTSAHTVYV